jgi:hypothetical protein
VLDHIARARLRPCFRHVVYTAWQMPSAHVNCPVQYLAYWVSGMDDFFSTFDPPEGPTDGGSLGLDFNEYLNLHDTSKHLNLISDEDLLDNGNLIPLSDNALLTRDVSSDGKSSKRSTSSRTPFPTMTPPAHIGAYSIRRLQPSRFLLSLRLVSHLVYRDLPRPSPINSSVRRTESGFREF